MNLFPLPFACILFWQFLPVTVPTPEHIHFPAFLLLPPLRTPEISQFPPPPFLASGYLSVPPTHSCHLCIVLLSLVTPLGLIDKTSPPPTAPAAAETICYSNRFSQDFSPAERTYCRVKCHRLFIRVTEDKASGTKMQMFKMR